MVLRDRYGGRRAFLEHVWSLGLLYSGRLHRHRAIDWTQVRRLVFVCKGNICRSAYARAKAASAGFPTTSFGIAATAGKPADASAIEHAATRKVSLALHQTTTYREFSPLLCDLLVCMEPMQANFVAKAFPNSGLQITLLGLWSRPRRPYLFDPQGASEGYWRTCLDIIDSGLDHILALIDGKIHDASGDRA